MSEKDRVNVKPVRDKYNQEPTYRPPDFNVNRRETAYKTMMRQDLERAMNGMTWV